MLCGVWSVANGPVTLRKGLPLVFNSPTVFSWFENVQVF